MGVYIRLINVLLASLLVFIAVAAAALKWGTIYASSCLGWYRVCTFGGEDIMAGVAYDPVLMLVIVSILSVYLVKKIGGRT